MFFANKSFRIFPRILGAAVLLAALLILSASPIFAQSDDINDAIAPPQPNLSELTFVYETVFPETGFEGGRDIAVDAAGNAYVLARSYDTNNDVLIIKLDPSGAELWRTVLAGSGHDFGTGIVVDDNGDAYIVGTTHSDDFPVLNAYQASRNGFVDAFLTKVSGQDGSLIFSTYFGGSRAEYSGDIAFDPAGNLVIVGQTDSTDLETVNPLQPSLNLSNCFCDDAFVTTFAADGGSLLYSTYLGGGLTDGGIALDVDDAGNIYLAGVTESHDFPLANPLDATYGGERDGFIARISQDGSQLDYSSYLGGDDWDLPSRLVVDGAGYAHVVGSTQSPDFPTTPGAFQEQFVGGILDCGSAGHDLRNCQDVFVTKIAPDGSQYAFSTFLGGGLDDTGSAISLDANGRVHVAGYTQSGDFPLLNGTSPDAVIFVTQLDANGSNLAYVEGIDSPVANDGHGLALGVDGDIYVTGAQNVPSDLYVARLTQGTTLTPLHVDSIDLRLRSHQGVYDLTGRITVEDNDGQSISGATVSLTWTLPDGTQKQRLLVTNDAGQVFTRIADRQAGEYVLQVNDVAKEGYLFDTANSQLTASIVAGTHDDTEIGPVTP